MSIELQRSELRKQYDELMRKMTKLPQDQWAPLLDQQRVILDRLERSYHSRPGFWWLRTKRLIGRIWQIITFAPGIVRKPSDKPFGACLLLNSIAKNVGLSDYDRIDITEKNLTDWLGDDITRQTNFDPSPCFRKLNRHIYKGFAYVVNQYGRLWFEVVQRDRITVYVGHRRHR